jgi:IPT/TIG domain
VATVVGAPLLQANVTGDRVFLSFATSPGGPMGIWDASSPNHFTTSGASESSNDLAVASDGTMFATFAANNAEIRGSDLILKSTLASPKLERIPGRVSVPGMTLHPRGSLIYQPFLTGPAPPESPNPPPNPSLRGGIDVLDAHSGRLRLRIMLPEPFAMRDTDIDGLHGGFLTVDENGQRIFALRASGMTIVQLVNVPLGIGTLSPLVGPATGGTLVTIRGSGFQSGTTVTIGGKLASATCKDINTLAVVISRTHTWSAANRHHQSRWRNCRAGRRHHHLLMIMLPGAVAQAL